jgi:hypothetical protein
MKKWLQISKYLLITIYCFGIYTSINNLPVVNYQSIDKSSSQKQFTTFSHKVISYHTQESENLISDFTEFSLPNFNLSSLDFHTVLYANELLLHAKFKQYKTYLQTLRIRQKKSNLIFPFHNFW